MNIDVPERVLELLAEIAPVDEHDDNGPGAVVCPACGGYTYMRWNSGKRMDSPDDVVHDSDCPAVWARRTLTPNVSLEGLAGSGQSPLLDSPSRSGC